jgi:hypothetical protein
VAQADQELLLQETVAALHNNLHSQIQVPQLILVIRAHKAAITQVIMLQQDLEHIPQVAAVEPEPLVDILAKADQAILAQLLMQADKAVQVPQLQSQV